MIKRHRAIQYSRPQSPILDFACRRPVYGRRCLSTLRSCFKNYCAWHSGVARRLNILMYSHVHSGVTRPLPGARPRGASLRLFKIVPDDFVAAVRLALPSLVTFSKQLLNVYAQAVGNVKTSCKDDAPAANITRRSRPRAIPVQSGNPCSRACNRRVSRGTSGSPRRRFFLR
jgi:hypothetical protein